MTTNGTNDDSFESLFNEVFSLGACEVGVTEVSGVS